MKSRRAILVCGGRHYADAVTLDRELTALNPRLVMHGDAPGADTLAGKWCRRAGVTVFEVPALWDAQGKPAGPIRNRAMLWAFLRICGPDLHPLVVAFPGNEGTANMVRQALTARVPVLEVR